MASDRRYEVAVKYLKCLRNHAAGSLAVVLDGCCEFAPGVDGTPNFQFCAACGCHRHFHQRVEKLVPSAFIRNPAECQLIKSNSPVVALPAPSSPNQPQSTENKGEIEMETGLETKVKTKITPEQKEALRAFADRVGWTLRNCDQEGIMQVCTELGITRAILKNWINNNRKRMGPGQEGTSAQDPEVIVLQN